MFHKQYLFSLYFTDAENKMFIITITEMAHIVVEKMLVEMKERSLQCSHFDAQFIILSAEVVSTIQTLNRR